MTIHATLPTPARSEAAKPCISAAELAAMSASVAHLIRMPSKRQALIDQAEALEPFDDRDRPHSDMDRDPYFTRRF